MAAPGDFSERQHVLRIGDTVFLYARDIGGYVLSELSSSIHNSVVAERRCLEAPHLPNVHLATFKVVTANKFKAQARYVHLKKLFKSGDAGTTEKGLLLQAEKHVQIELRENEARQEHLRGSTVVYGESIQLLHTLSKMYLSVSTTTTSRTESTNLLVKLRPENIKGCIFKILPQYKVRAVGDEVHYHDQVKFESVRTEGQFLHCSVRLLNAVGFNVHANCHEVNLSPTESALTLVPHYRPARDHHPLAFRAGNTVRLFHREHECYVTAEGSFTELPPVTEDVHCRKRRVEYGILKAPSTSANTYWQFERESDPRSGEPLSWGERVRIKHLPTRCYLTVVQQSGEFLVTLDDSAGSTSGSVFCLYPVIEEGDVVLVESYTRIKHLQTRTWLHLKKEPYVRRNFDCDAPGLMGLQWDKAELFTLTATETMNYDDTFTLEHVNESLLDKFNYVAGIVPVLTTHIAEQEKPGDIPLEPKEEEMVSSALIELAQFLVTPNPRDTKDRQKLLRNLKVLELVIRIVGFFDPQAVDHNEQRSICQACYLVIENYLKGNSRKNENYLARFMDFFTMQSCKGLNAEKVMIEMCEDNLAIVSRMSTSELDSIIELLILTKDPRFMCVLGNLCVCGSRPIPSTQNTILERLAYQHGKDLFYRIEIGGSTKCPSGASGVVHFQKPGSREWTPLVSVAAKGSPVYADDAEFLEYQFQLFGKMCKGNNRHIILTLQRTLGYITFDAALTCAQDQELHPKLRSEFVHLIMDMFVDVGENRDVLGNLSYSFVYDDVKENPYEDVRGDATTALTGIKNPHFPRMREWIRSHVSMAATKKLVASEVDDNNLLAQVLGVLALLVKYGYYHKPRDMDYILSPLLSVLEGTNDCPSPPVEETPLNAVQIEMLEKEFREEGRFKASMENRAIFAVKERAMEIVECFLKLRLYFRLQKFISDFRLLVEYKREEYTQVEDTFQTYASAYAQLATRRRPPSQLVQLMKRPEEQDTSRNQGLDQLARERLEFIFSQSAYSFESPNSSPPFPEILLDLSRYECDELVQGSLHLLNLFFSSELILFNNALQSQLLITEESKETFADVGELLPNLRRYLSVDARERERSVIIRVLRRLTMMCYPEREGNEPCQQTQTMLYNSGIMTDILKYVFKHANNVAMSYATDESTAREPGMPRSKLCSTTTERKRKRTGTGSSPSSMPAVFTQCFKFLKALSHKNVEMQQRLYKYMDDLLEIEVAVPYMAEVLTEVFNGGLEICLKVREEQVERVFQLVVTGGKEGRAELIGILQAMARLEELGLPVKRNQSFIIKHFGKTREKLCDHILGEECQETRMNLLTKATDDDSDLQLLLAMTDLLASCSEGENRFIESVCQNIYTEEELLQILTNPALPPNRKRPFARFLVWVYMSTKANSFTLSIKIPEFIKTKEMWEYLEQLGALLREMEEVLAVSRPLRIEVPHDAVCYLREEGLVGSTTSSNGSIDDTCVNREDGMLLSGILPYFTDGILPLLKSYYTHFFAPDWSQGGKGDKHMMVSVNLLTALLRLCNILVSDFLEDYQVRLYRATVITILAGGPNRVHFEVDDQLLTNFAVKTTQEKRAVDAYRMRNRVYSSEVQLNEMFHTYVSNYRRAYQGRSAACLMKGSGYETVHLDLDDEGLTQPHKERFLLGPSFQKHVACFCNREESNPDDIVKPTVDRLLTQLQVSFRKLDTVERMERQRQDELDIKCLQILRAIIHNQILLIDPELKDNNPAAFRRECKTRVHPVQNAIQGFGNAVARIVPLLSHPNGEIVREVLAFLEVILYSGNRTVQEGMNHLLATREERLFTSMKTLLQNAVIVYRERRNLLAQMKHGVTEDEQLNEVLAEHSGGWEEADVEGKPVRILIELDEEQSCVERTTEQWTLSRTPSPCMTPIAKRSALSRSASPGMMELTATVERLNVSRSASSQSASPNALELTPMQRKRAKNARVRHSSRPSSDLDPLISTLLRKNGSAAKGPQQSCSLEAVNAEHKVAQVIVFKDSHHSKLALRVLGLMCDGQYRLMQNYLRDQPDNIRTINIVGEVAHFIQHFYNDIDAETMELVHLILQTLIEICVGNYPNQSAIFNCQIIDVINRILEIDIAEQRHEIKHSVNLKASAVELLEVMIEQTNDKSKELVAEIRGALDIPAVHDTLADFYELMNDPNVKRQGFDDEAERGLFRTYHVLVHLSDYPGVQAECLEPKDEEVKKAWNFCRKSSKSIEICYKNMKGEKILTRVHFQFDPAVKGAKKGKMAAVHTLYHFSVHRMNSVKK